MHTAWPKPHLPRPSPAPSSTEAKGLHVSGRCRRPIVSGVVAGGSLPWRGRPDDSPQESQAPGARPCRQDRPVLFDCPPAFPFGSPRRRHAGRELRTCGTAFATEMRAHAATNRYRTGFAVPAQLSDEAPAGVIGPDCDWVARCPRDGTPSPAVADLGPAGPRERPGGARRAPVSTTGTRSRTPAATTAPPSGGCRPRGALSGSLTGPGLTGKSPGQARSVFGRVAPIRGELIQTKKKTSQLLD